MNRPQSRFTTKSPPYDLEGGGCAVRGHPAPAGCRMGRVADIPAAVVPTVTIEAGTSPFAEGDALRSR